MKKSLKTTIKPKKQQALANIDQLISLAEKALDNLGDVEELYPEVERYIQKDETLKLFFEQEKCGNLTLLAYDYEKDYPKFWTEAKKSGKKRKCIDKKLICLLDEISILLSNTCKCAIDMQDVDTEIIEEHIARHGTADIYELGSAIETLQNKIESLEFYIDETQALEDGFPGFLFDEDGNFGFDESDDDDFDE